MFAAWTPVQVTNDKLERYGQAGTVRGVDSEDNTRSLVCFDVDSEIESVANADLKALG